MGAKKDNLIGRRADLLSRGFDQAQPQYGGTELHVVEVAGDLHGRRERPDAGRMIEHVLFGVIDVMKAHGLGNLSMASCLPVKKCQPSSPPRATVAGDVGFLFLGRQLEASRPDRS